MIKNVMKVVKEIEKNQSGADEFPVWWDGKQLDESAFCEWFAYKHELMFVGSQFFDIDGILSEERLSKEILEDTLKQLAIIALIYLVATFAIIEVLSRSLTERIEKLAGHIREYTNSRDVKVADSIDESINGTDEIADLSSAFSNLIRQVEKQIKNLYNTREIEK